MNETEAIKRIQAAIRKLERLSAEIASGNLSKRADFSKVRDNAYHHVRWINSGDQRNTWLDRIEAVPFTSAIESGEAVARERQYAELSRMTREIRDSKPRPGTWDFELELLRGGN